VTIERAKQIALLVAVAGATVYRVLEEMQPVTKVKVIRSR
jgi:hypothetical protein